VLVAPPDPVCPRIAPVPTISRPAPPTAPLAPSDGLVCKHLARMRSRSPDAVLANDARAPLAPPKLHQSWAKKGGPVLGRAVSYPVNTHLRWETHAAHEVPEAQEGANRRSNHGLLLACRLPFANPVPGNLASRLTT
jgi:hypothetical protein